MFLRVHLWLGLFLMLGTRALVPISSPLFSPTSRQHGAAVTRAAKVPKDINLKECDKLKLSPLEQAMADECETETVRDLSPLERALLSDPPTGRFVNEGWTEDCGPSAPEVPTTSQFFESFDRSAIEKTLADKFFAIDE